MIEYIISLFLFFIVVGIISAIGHLSLHRKYKKAMQKMQANYDRVREENDKSYRDTMQKIQADFERINEELNNYYSVPDFENTEHEPLPIFIPSDQNLESDLERFRKIFDSSNNIPDFEDTEDEALPIFIPSAKDDIQTA